MADQADLASQLLGLARDDEAAARAMLAVADVTDSIVGFHAQQAVEKALKAVLASRSIDFPFSHNLAVLMQLCEDAGLTLPSPLTDADRLTPYGLSVRYGTAAPGERRPRHGARLGQRSGCLGRVRSRRGSRTRGRLLTGHWAQARSCAQLAPNRRLSQPSSPCKDSCSGALS
jgi:HEPN domain-containing protein